MEGTLLNAFCSFMAFHPIKKIKSQPKFLSVSVFPRNWATQLFYTIQRAQQAIHVSDLMVPFTARPSDMHLVYLFALGMIISSPSSLPLTSINHLKLTSLPPLGNSGTSGPTWEPERCSAPPLAATAHGADTGTGVPADTDLSSHRGQDHGKFLICRACLLINHAFQSQYQHQVFSMVNRM